MFAETIDVAKRPTGKPKAKRPPGRPPAAEGPRVQVIGIRGREEWKEWLRQFAESHRAEMAELIDDALEAFAKAKGFRPPPKR